MSEWKPLSLERERAIREKGKFNHFQNYMEVVMDLIESGHTRLILPVREELTQLQGVLHGGAVAALIDMAVAVAIVSVSDSYDRFSTIDMSLKYLSPIKGGRAIADAQLIKNGRRVVTAKCDVSDDEGRLAATALITYLRLEEEK